MCAREAGRTNREETDRCELQAGCTLRGDIEAPQLMVNENATFLGSAKVGTGKSSRPDVRSELVVEVKSCCFANHSSRIGAVVNRKCAKFFSRSHDAVIHVFDDAGGAIETHEQRGNFKEW